MTNMFESVQEKWRLHKVRRRNARIANAHWRDGFTLRVMGRTYTLYYERGKRMQVVEHVGGGRRGATLRIADNPAAIFRAFEAGW